LQDLGVLLLELLVGLALGLTAWYLLAKYFEVWRYDQSLVSTGFLVTLAIFGYLTPQLGDRLGRLLRPRPADAPPAPPRRWLMTIKVFLGAIVVPLAALVVAGRFSLSGTAPAYVPPPNAEYQYAAQIADAVLASTDPAARVAGIEALQSLPAVDGAPMLARLYDRNPAILSDAGTYTALKAALAADGPESKAWLLGTFAAHAKAAAGAAAPGPAGDLYAYYFQQPFAALQQDVTNTTSDPTALAELQLNLTTAEAQLKSSLEVLQARQPAPTPDALALDFVLDTLGQMSITDDPDIYRLARDTAGDAAYPESVRRRAIRLVGQYGSSADFDFLLKSMQDSDELIRAAAFAAFQTLYHKTHH
jgi:hypothetical protein